MSAEQEHEQEFYNLLNTQTKVNAVYIAKPTISVWTII